MKIHLPLTLRGLLLSILTASAPSFAAGAPADVPEIGYTNPVFDQTLDHDLHFTQYFHQGNNVAPDLGGDAGTMVNRIELLGSGLTLAGPDDGSADIEVSFISARGDALYTGRAIHLANGGTFEAAHLGAFTVADHLYRNAYDFRGAIAASSGSALSFHHNETVLFENNIAYWGAGGVMNLEESSLLLEDNETVVFRGNGDRGSEGLSGVDGGGALSLTKSELSVRNNRSVLFEGNANAGRGGAISAGEGPEFLSSSSIFAFSENGSVSFQGNTSESEGGAVYVKGVFSVGNNENVSFTSNRANNGGAISMRDYAKTDISNNGAVLFEKNAATSTRGGGAIYSASDILALDANTSLRFSENEADVSSGGAINTYSMELAANTAAVFSGNTAGVSGGALYIKGNTSGMKLSVINNTEATFSGNAAAANGGAIYLNGQSLFDNNALLQFSGNTAGNNGGAIDVNSSTLSLTGNQAAIFDANWAASDGGAVYFYGDRLLFSGNDSLRFTSNAAEKNGGAIYFFMQHMTLENNGEVTFANNVAAGEGGAIYVSQGYVNIVDNDAVTFRGNHVLQKDADGKVTGAVLNSLRVRTAKAIALSTRADDWSQMTIYDPVRIEESNDRLNIALNGFTPSGSSEAFTGTGGITFSGEYAREDLTRIFEENGLEAAGDVFEACLADSLTSNLAGRATLMGGSLDIVEGASVHMAQLTAKQGSDTYLSDGGRLNVTGTASFEAGSTFGAYFETDGAPCVLNAGSLKMTGATLDCGAFAGASSSLLTLNADTTLADCDLVFRAAKTDAGEYVFGDGVLVNGSLAVQGRTRVIFASESESEFLAPSAQTTLLRCDPGANGTVNGDADTWEALTTRYDLNLRENVYEAVDTGYVRDRYESNAWVVEFVLNETPPPPPAPEDIVISTGEEKSIDDLSAKVRLAGGTLDVTGIDAATPLTNSAITGDGGLLQMADGQTLVLKGRDSVGYDVAGKEGAPGGTMTAGASGGLLGQTEIALKGDVYDVAALDVQSGNVTLGSQATLGRLDTTEVTLGSSPAGDTTTASLINEGAILAQTVGITANAAVTNKGSLQTGNIKIANKAVLGNDGEIDAETLLVQRGGSLYNTGTLNGEIALEGNMSNNGKVADVIRVANGGRLSGSGTFNSVFVQSGGLLMAGNSPGAPVYTNLTLENGATMAFSVDGATPASATYGGSGTHSIATIADTLTLNGTTHVTVEIGSGIVASGGNAFTLTLLNAANVAGTGSIDTSAMTLSGESQLLEDGATLRWDAATGTLTFTGKVNESAAAALSGNDAALLADTMWSSTASVTSFARTAMSQAQAPGTGKSRFWMAGLGNFTSMSSEGALDGFSYDGGGYAVGGDVKLADKTTLGAAVGQTFGTHKSDDSLLSDKQRSLMFALYGNYREELVGGNSLDLSGYLAYGSVNHRARTHVGGSLATPGRAEWDDDVFTFGLLAHWNLKLGETLTLSPFSGISYAHGAQGDVNETFEGGSRRFEDGSMQVWSIPVGATLKAACSLGGGQMLLPELTVAYVGDVARQNPSVRTQSAGASVSSRGHAPGRSALMTRAGLAWKISESWSTGASYTLETRSGQIDQSVNLSVNYSF